MESTKVKASLLFYTVLAAFLFGLALNLSLAAVPQMSEQKVYTANSEITNAYIQDGLIAGGDRVISDVIVLDVRHSLKKAASGGLTSERMVLDLEGNQNGDPSAIGRPPYYQVAVQKNLRRLEITIFGSPKLAFDAKQIRKRFMKSRLLKNAELLPLVEKDRWTFVLNSTKPLEVEVFELSNPVRVVVDMRAIR